MKEYLLGIDIGTTNVKGMLFTKSGTLVTQESRGTYSTHTPYANWAEQDANLWWEDTVFVISEITKRINKDKGRIVGIGISSQGLAMLPVDKTGTPLRHAMIWMDRRSTSEAIQISEYIGKERFQVLFGSAADPSFQMPKLLWFKKNEPELFSKTYKVLMTNGYINYKLTGVYSVDSMQGKFSHCYDNVNNEWSKELELYSGISLNDILPPIVESDQVMGMVTKEAAQITGLDEGTPVIAGTADATAALLEVGLGELGEAVEISGTSSNIMFAYQYNSVPENVGLMSQPSIVNRSIVKSLLFGAINNTGGSLKWYANVMGRDLQQLARSEGHGNVYKIMDYLAEQASAGSRGLIYHPYLLGERAPLWNDYVRGAFLGLTSGTTQNDVIRSLMEGTSYALRHVMDHALLAGAKVNKFYITGGCANSDIWLRIKASVLKRPLYVLSQDGGSPLGVAIMAGYGVGILNDYKSAVEKFRKITKVVEPNQEWVGIYDKLYELYISMREHLEDDWRKLSTITKEYKM